MGSVVSINQARGQRKAMETGYIKVYRSIQECSFKRDPERFALWVHMLLEATHKPISTMLGGSPITIHAGQFVSGIRDLSAETGVSFQRVRSSLDFFEKEGMIARSKGRSGTVFTIQNFGDFQGKNGDFCNTPATHQNHTQDNTPDATDGAAFKRNETHQSSHQQHTESSHIQENNKYISITNVIDCHPDDENSDKESKKKNAKNSPVPYKKIADLFNEIMDDTFPRIQVYDSKKRKSLLKTFWSTMKEDLGRTEAYFKFFNANCRPFHKGDNDRGWIASVDYICREDTITKARENTL